MAIDDQPVAFNRAGVKRIVQATKVIEDQYRNEVQGGRYSGGAGNRGLVMAKTGGSGISAFTPEVVSPATPARAGSGDITLYDMAENGDLTATGVTLKCWNLGGAIGVNKDILVAFGTRGP